MKFLNLDFVFSAHYCRYFLAYHDVFIAPKNLNYEPKVNLLIKLTFDNKYTFEGGEGLSLPPLTHSSFFLFPAFSQECHPSSTKKKGLLNSYETIAARSSSMINKQ